MTRRYAWPEGHWAWPIPVTHKHGVRSGDLCFVGGQVDLAPTGEVLHAGDIAAQAPAAMASMGRVLRDLDAGLGDLAKLTVFHAAATADEERALLELVAATLPAGARPALSAVPLPQLAYPGMLVEIEGVAAVGEHRRVGGAGAFADAVQCGELIFLSAQAAPEAPGDIVRQTELVMARLGDVLGELGATLDDSVRFAIWYVGTGTAEDWEVAARVRARSFAEPGPAATGIPVPRLPGDELVRMEVWAMRGVDGRPLPRRHSWPEGHWNWPIHLPYKHGCACGDMLFVGGQVSLTPHGEVIDPDDMVAQTRRSMANVGRVLEGLDAGLDDVVKVTTYYEGGASADELHANLAIRSASFTEPGPATTGIPLPCLAYDEMVIEIEVIGMRR
jgi:enamine deaminase RidA (YjgF/YER057c/UK114 family)